MKLFFILLLISSQAFARWATKADLEYVLLKEESIVKVKKNGSNTMIQSLEYELLKDSAKERFSIYKIPYRSNTTSIKILSVKVINGNNVYEVAKDKIVDRSVSQDKGIDDTKEIQIPLPNIQVNSRIIIKYQQDVQKVVVSGHFSTSYQMGEGGQADESFLSIESELPLYYEKNDPFNVLEVMETKDSKKHLLTMKLNKPYLKKTVEEFGVLNLSKMTFLNVSTEKDWVKIGTNLKRRFDNVLVQDLPKSLGPIVKDARALKTLDEKVNHLVAYITQNYNYVGDWRTLKGAFSPRDIKEIVGTRYGDCKDFSTLLTLLLRKVDIKADVATVYRSSSAQAGVLKYGLPSIGLFNHAIVRLQAHGKNYWIDPTNKVSYGLNHRDDIAGKSALILDGSHSLATIPLVNDEPNELKIEKIITFDSETNGSAETKIALKGNLALALTGLEVNVPKDKLEAAFLGMASSGEEPIVPEFTPYDLKSFKYKPLNLHFEYTAGKISFKEEEKHYAKFYGMEKFLGLLNSNFKHWESDLFLGEPFLVERSLFLKNVFAEVRPKGCSLSTEWIDIRREFDFHSEGLKITDKLHFKKNIIPNSSFKSTDFELLGYGLSSCFSESFVKFNYKNKAHAESEADVEARFAKLPPSERVLKRTEFVRDILNKTIKTGFNNIDLVYFLKKNLEDDPTHPKSYEYMASIILHDGYLNNDKFNKANILQAKEIIANGLKYNPKHQGLLLDDLELNSYLQDLESVKKGIPEVLALGELQEVNDLTTLSRLYKRLGDKSKAIAALKSAEKIAKTDIEKKRVWFVFASLYSHYQQPAQCVQAYNQVLKYDPKDSYTHINVISCLINLKKYDEAVERAKAGREVTTAGMMMWMSSLALISRGHHLAHKGKVDEAEKDFKESLQYRNDSDAYVGLAGIAAAKNNYDRTLSLLMEGAKYHEGDKHEFLGRYGTLFKNDPESHVKFMNLVLDHIKDPATRLLAYNDTGTSLIALKRKKEFNENMEKAITYGESLVQSSPKDFRILSTLGYVYEFHGKELLKKDLLEKARKCLALALEVNKGDINTTSRLNDLTRVIKEMDEGRMPASVGNVGVEISRARK